MHQFGHLPKVREHCQVGAELFHADGRADRQTNLTKLIVAFRNSVNAPTDQVRCLSSYSSKETYSAKCPGILPNTNKLSYEVIDHDYIRWYAYDTVET